MTELMTTKQVAKKTKLSVRTLERLRKNGQLSWLQLGGRVRFSEAQVLDFLARQERGHVVV